MKRTLLLLMTLVLAALGAKAAITISTASVNVGGTSVSGYAIEGAKAGELALLLSGDNSVSVQWNGVNLNQLKSAEYIKVGTSSNPNVLGDADLMALDLLSGAKYLDIDGSVLADGADITKIEAGPAIEAVTLPNCLTKDQVNAVGVVLTAFNANFGSCLSLDTEMEETQVTTYTYTDPCTSEKVDYTGEVSGSEGNYTGTVPTLTRDITLISSSFSYTNTKFPNDVVTLTEEQVKNADGTYKTTWTPESLKVALTENKVLAYSYNGQIYKPNGTDGGVWWLDSDGRVNSNYSGIEGLSEGDYLQDASSYTYTYQFWNGNYDGPTYTCPAENVQGEAGARYCVLANPDNHYSFPINSSYTYSYTGTDCSLVTVENSPTYPGETIDLDYNQTVPLEATTITVNVPKEGGWCNAIAYVNTPGTLYKATSLDINDATSATGLVISGTINNGDLAWGVGSSSADPQYTKGDADKYEPNGAIPAVSAFNSAPKSVDLSDVVLEDGNYRYLRVLNAYGAKLESVVFPKTLTRIPNYCCYSLGNNGCQNLSEVVFPTEATSFTIGDYAFHHTALTSLLIPGGVTDIGDHAFGTCDKITDIEMEALSNTCHFGNYVFANCSALKHVTLSEKVENIGDYQFNQCGLLESIRIPSTCKTIGSYSFYECFSIHQMTIPEGVELIKINAFELAGITDLYIMAKSIDKVPKIYAMSPTGEGPSTFSYQRTTGNNTAPQNHRDEMGEGSTVHYDEAMSWYQEEQSGPQGLGTGNCLLAIHYPESMKPFYEAINVEDFYSAEQLATIPLQTLQSGIQHYYTPEDYIAMVPEEEGRRAYIQNELANRKQDGTTPAYNFGDVEYQYLPQTYAIDAFPTGFDNDRPIGPDADGRFYPNQHDYWIRMAAGATSTQAGGVGGEEVASAWGWRQFPLATSVESIGETPFEKEYDDTWYTMAFPWRMIDNQLFSAFNQKCEIVEFVGAEVFELDDPSTENVVEYSLVFHFDNVAKTYYMDDNNVEYFRERDGDKVDAIGHKVYVYTNKTNPDDVVRCPDEALSSSYNPKNASPEVKEAYGRYLNIQNVIVVAGHPYMIHPSIGAAPGNPATVYINGVKKLKAEEGKTLAQTLRDKADAEAVTITTTKDGEFGTPGVTEFLNPVTNQSGDYTFIGNIDDIEKNAAGEITYNGAQDMPIPSYFLAVEMPTGPDGTPDPANKDEIYPKYYRKKSGGKGKWTQYSAIIRAEQSAIDNIEVLRGMTIPATGSSYAKAGVAFGEWLVVDNHTIQAITTEAREKGLPVQEVKLNVVYNINGQIVRNGTDSIEGLPRGLYIVNGKKYMVK